MCFRSLILATMVATCCLAGVFAQEVPAAGEVRASSEQLVKAFNAGKPDEVASFFLPEGELIDEHGVVHQGQKEIASLLTAYFSRYPGATVANTIDSIRLVGPVAIEEGTRTLTTGDKSAQAKLRYMTVRIKSSQGWQIASLRDFDHDSPPTPHEFLQPLSWLVGDWINEGSDAVVKISYRWSEDLNFLLGDFLVTNGGDVIMKTSQRIGWDPLVGSVRSWIFDSDGGYGEGRWAQVGDEWVIKSSAVLPDGQTGSATITLTQGENGRYKFKSTDRIVGNERADDFEVTVTRRPPVANTPAGGK